MRGLARVSRETTVRSRRGAYGRPVRLVKAAGRRRRGRRGRGAGRSVGYPVRSMALRATIKKYTPERTVNWYRRRREIRIYNRELGDNLWLQRLRTLDAQQSGKQLTPEEAIADGNSGMWLQWAVWDIIERNDIVLKAMERKIEALTARHGQQIRNIKDDVQGLRDELEALRKEIGASREPAEPAAAPPTEAEPSVATPEALPADAE